MKQLVFFCFLIFTNFIQGFGQDNVLLSNTNKHDSVNNSHKFLDLFNIGMPKTVFDSIIKNKNWKLVFINRDSLYINSDSFDIYLDKYLNIYSSAMNNKWGGNLNYIDLFCGPGKSRIKETNNEFDGSPLISLKYHFNQYIFVDKNEENIDILGLFCL